MDLKGNEVFLFKTWKRTSLREISENKIKRATLGAEWVEERGKRAFRKTPEQREKI